MIGRERFLDAADGQLAFVEHAAGVVEQHIDAVVVVADFIRESANFP